MALPNPSSTGIRFTTRGLLLFMLFCALGTALWVYMYTATRQSFGYGPYATFDKWPRALIELIGEDKALRREVEPFGLGGIIDHRSIWLIKPGSKLRDALFDTNELESADRNHPKALQLIASVPSGWGDFPWDRCTWHATPGYGTTHIEGVDLYLIAEDPDTGQLIVLHEWIF